MQKQKEAKSLFWVLRTDLNLLDSAIRRIYKVDCHADSANLLAMTEYCGFAVDLRSQIAIEVMAVEVLYL